MKEYVPLDPFTLKDDASGWAETVKRLTDADLAKLFEGEECLRAAA